MSISGLDVARALEVRDALEDAGTVQARQQLARGRAVIPVEHGIHHVIQIVGRGVPEDQCLDHRRNEQAHAAARSLSTARSSLRVSARMRSERADQAIHARVLRITARLPSASAAAMAASTSVFGTITGHTSPARKTLCSSAT